MSQSQGPQKAHNLLEYHNDKRLPNTLNSKITCETKKHHIHIGRQYRTRM